MNLIRFDITLTLRAPIFSAAQGGRRFGIDSAVLRDWDDRPAISGALVRGNLRHSWRELNEYRFSVALDDWLGKPANGGGRSRLSFSHWFSACKAGDPQAVRHRIQLNDQGTVARGALQIIESPFSTGEKVDFSGHAWVSLRDDENPKELARLIRKGLMWVPALGGFKTAGFGKIENVEVGYEREARCALQQVASDSFGLILEFDRPICFSRAQTGKSENNIFVGEYAVPGAAIIAVLAERWPEGIKDQLDKLRITHALPAHKENLRRPIAIPCSLAYVKNRVMNLAKVEGPLIDGAAPTFQPDWKGNQWVDVLKLCGWPSLDRILETRTAIEFGKNTASQSQLFSMESIDTRGHVWLANVDLAAIDDDKREEVRKTLLTLFSDGLWPLGKTDARASVKVSAPHGFAANTGTSDKIGEEVVLSLVTDAELLTPIPKAEEIRGPDTWRMAYDEIFRRLSGNALTVTRHFSREKLVGGGYLHHRFGNGKNYTPRLLTTAGSVFVLKVIETDQAEKHLDNWLAHGLPSLSGESWQTCPYLPQNGYGEIAINFQLHKGGIA